MTNNQVAYWNYQELVRSNRAKEAENERANRVREAETERANRASERIAFDRYQEEVRTNKQNEAIKWASVSESVRHNKEVEAIEWVGAGLKKAETGYTQQKTKTEAYETVKSRSEATLIGAEANFATPLAEAKVSELESRTFKNYASGVGSIAEAILAPLKYGFIW